MCSVSIQSERFDLCELCLKPPYAKSAVCAKMPTLATVQPIRWQYSIYEAMGLNTGFNTKVIRKNYLISSESVTIDVGGSRNIYID